MKSIKGLVTFIFFLFLSQGTIIVAQIYEPEGLNIPGSWNDWTNPPSNMTFAGSAQTAGGQVTLQPLGYPVYQTIFEVKQGGAVTGGDYEFKFTSGPLDNIWQNQWGSTTVEIDVLQPYYYGTVGGGNPPDNNTVTLQNDRWYVINWNNVGYENSTAIFMELNGEPSDILSVQQLPILPSNTEEVEITIEISSAPASDEYFFVRYTTTNWFSSDYSEFSFTGTTGVASIPPHTHGEEVTYYVFSSAMQNPETYWDSYTVKFDNNNGSNYSYTVGDTLSCGSDISLISTEPVFPLEENDVIITFNAELGNGGLSGYNDTVYAHTGVITNLSTSSSDWKYVKTDWGENTPDTKLTLIDSNLYQLNIPNIRDYYGVPDGEDILQMAFVFRSHEPVNGTSYLEGKTSENGDIFIDVYVDELNVKITYPTYRNNLFDPNELVPVCATSLNSPTGVGVFFDGEFIGASPEGTQQATLGILTSDHESGSHWLEARAGDDTELVYDSLQIFIRGEVPVADLPEGVEPGINYLNDNEVTLVLHDPAKLKKYAFVIGDFNNWSVDEDSYMYCTPEGEYYWITLSGLTPGQEYAYQYYIDGELKLADPFCDKILDPWNDKWIPEENYPNLKEYPFDKTTGIVSVFETGKDDYNWIIDDFTPVAVHETQSNLIIYELLVRDFVADRRIASVTDSLDYLAELGINAIELMPVTEFEGNDSWGYNPSYYFATDKAYGTTNDYKRFIDECHQRGIAVIFDVVLNHSFGQSPMVQMYWDGSLNQPTASNPWYNRIATHPLSPGYDFNHESQATKEFTKRFFRYWVEEFKVDGFRLDLSKGFTQTYTGDDIGAWSQYDQSRVNILTDYYNSIKETDPDTYVILEHLSDNSEEVVLANTGMLTWGKMTEQFNQNTMGWEENSDFSWAYYTDRGYTYPNLIPYMESHDEERLMYKNLQWGNGSGSYSIKDLPTAISRMATVAPMYYMVPGPKMIWQFGELGYDYSINYCDDGTISEDCRTQAKPIRWDYFNDDSRAEVYKVMSAMAELKTSEEAFRLGTFGRDLSGMVKRTWLSHTSLNICAGSNFDVVNQSVDPGFQHTGTWYNYFTGESLDVGSTTGYNIELEPGEYYVFTDKQLQRPYVNLGFDVVYKESGNPVWGAEITLSGNGNRTTDAEGNATFLPFSNSQYEYVVAKQGHTTVTGQVNIAEDDLVVTVEIDGPDGLNEVVDGSIRVYPNPANSHITIESKDNFRLSLLTINGKILIERNINAGSNTINTTGLAGGIYILRFENGERLINRKLMVN